LLLFKVLSGVVQLFLLRLLSFTGSVKRASFFTLTLILLLESWVKGNYTACDCPRIRDDDFTSLSTDFYFLSALDLLLWFVSFIDFWTNYPKFYFTFTAVVVKFSLSGDAIFFGDFLLDFVGLCARLFCFCSLNLIWRTSKLFPASGVLL